MYQIGNDAEFHGGIFAIARRVPGVVVLHDPDLREFMWQLVDRGRLGRAWVEEQTEREHGVTAWADLGLGSGQRLPLELAGTCGAFGVVVHSRGAFERMRERTRLPLRFLPLPYPRRRSTASGGEGHDGLRLVMLGLLSPNRCLDRVMRAMAAYGGGVSLDVFGELWPGSGMERLAGELGLGGRVQFRGYVTEEELDEALPGYDLAINVRNPSVGEASGVQLRIWQAGVPTLATRVGWYAEQPEGTLAWVDTARMEESFIEHWEAYAKDRAKFAMMAEAGRKVYEASHGPESYARKIVEFACAASRQRLVAVVERMRWEIMPMAKRAGFSG